MMKNESHFSVFGSFQRRDKAGNEEDRVYHTRELQVRVGERRTLRHVNEHSDIEIHTDSRGDRGTMSSHV